MEVYGFLENHFCITPEDAQSVGLGLGRNPTSAAGVHPTEYDPTEVGALLGLGGADDGQLGTHLQGAR
ncbi:MAG: hypothetical protein GY696_00655 [Gammaproteobacteria bacterium]|nr:hypothetical protein [Gammaproteobacteria bacterium]